MASCGRGARCFVKVVEVCEGVSVHMHPAARTGRPGARPAGAVRVAAASLPRIKIFICIAFRRTSVIGVLIHVCSLILTIVVVFEIFSNCTSNSVSSRFARILHRLSVVSSVPARATVAASLVDGSARLSPTSALGARGICVPSLSLDHALSVSLAHGPAAQGCLGVEVVGVSIGTLDQVENIHVHALYIDTSFLAAGEEG
mmetsp:Transcript_30078/g.70114  ORF Transcript_30078/g.70114 Transcript_30078/m.70114 type:complete len:201 (+) Transcript_30078:1478-2080(+)